MSKIPSKQSTSPPSKVVFRPRRTPTGAQANPNGRDSLINSLKVGDRVTMSGKSGTIAFIGPTKFSEGEWIGINLDEPQGKNDGSHDGIRYFETDVNHGLFCRADKVKRLSINGVSQRNSMRLSSIEGASNNILGITSIDKLDLSSTKNLQLGDRVVIRGEKHGTLQYIGKFHMEEGIFCGVKLDGPLGKHDGKLDGKRYFTCPQRHGVFAPLRDVEKAGHDFRDSRRFSRLSIMSTDSNNQYLESASIGSHLSEMSTSPMESNHFPSRSPKKIRQPVLSPDVTSMEPTSSNQIANLFAIIKEKDLLIGSLQEQHEKDRLEFKRQYEIKENEKKILLKEQFELTERVEDLQVQLESNQADLIIPDNHRLVSLHEIRIYEEMKEKLIELESINKQLIEENQMFQEELEQQNQSDTLSDQLKKQIDLLQLQITDLETKEQIKTRQLAEKEEFYQQQIEQYQSKINQIIQAEQNIQLQITSFEQAKETNEKQVNDLFNELKEYQENIVPNLEKQCEMLKFELENRDQTVDMSLNEQQIKEYQVNINQATHQTENIRAELKQIQEENNLKEEKTNAFIDQLKQNYEKLQIELNDRDLSLNQSELNYEKQIKEYEDNLDRATREIERIQVELAKLEEEKVLHDKKSNTIINSLKEDYERQYEILKKQLIELQDQDQTENVNERITDYEIQIKEYQIKSEQDAQQTQSFLDELKSLQEEKIAHEKHLNQTIEILKQDHQELQTEIDQLNEREHTAHKTLHQYEAKFEQEIREYQEKLEQAHLQTQYLQSELEKLQEEKTNFSEIINTLTEDLQTAKTELQDRDQTAFNEQEAHYQSEINEYKIKREQALLEIQDLQSQLANIQEEKLTMEDELNQTINILRQDYIILQNKQEFEQQVKEDQEKLEEADLLIQRLQSDLDKFEEEKNELNNTIHSLSEDLETLEIDIQDLQSKVTNLEEEKIIIENELNETINTLKQQCEKLENEQQQILKKCQSQYEHEIDEYQKNLEFSICQAANIQSQLVTLQEEKESNEKILNDEINSLKTEFEEEIQRLRTQVIEFKKSDQTKEKKLKEYRAEFDETNELIQRIETLTRLNETLKNELEDIKNQNDPKEMNLLTQQVNDLQQMHINLLEKQAIKDQEYITEKKIQETLFQEKIDDYEVKMKLLRNEFMVEMENVKLDHDQEILRLKAQIPKLPPPKGKK